MKQCSTLIYSVSGFNGDNADLMDVDELFSPKLTKAFLTAFTEEEPEDRIIEKILAEANAIR